MILICRASCCGLNAQDEEGLSPILDVRVNEDWLTLDTRTCVVFFFSCIAGRVRDMVGQLLEIRVGLKAN